MALVKCSECGKEISSKAKSCPGCGSPVKAKGLPDSVSLLIFGGALFAVYLLFSSLGVSSGQVHQREVQACVDRGVAYFRATGSFPRLLAPPNKGKSAELEARERCNRTVTAF